METACFKIIPFLLLILVLPVACNEEKVQQPMNNPVAKSNLGENLPFLGETGIVSDEMVAFYIKQVLDSAEHELKSPHLRFNDRRIWKTVRKSYQNRKYSPIWEMHKKRKGLHLQFLSVLDTIHYEGLEKSDYNYELIRGLLDKPAENDLQKMIYAAEADVAFTAAFIKLNRHLKYGRSNPNETRMRWHIYQDPETRPDALLEAVLANNNILQAIEASRPKFQQYQKLRQLLKYYSTLAEHPDWKKVPMEASLAKGQRSGSVEQLKINLVAAGFLGSMGDSADFNFFDDKTEQALKTFQHRFNIKPTGIAGPITLKEINAPLDEKILQVKLNLERLRWLPEDLGKRYIWVNVPDFWLKVVDNGETVLQMKIIAGKSFRPTPIFSDKIQYLVFSPYWNVPKTLAVSDILPKIQNNPNYLHRMRFEVLDGWGEDAKILDPDSIDWQKLNSGNFPFRLRQKPGPWNAMGNVKFMFPNSFQIYLHDTSTPGLFKRENRAFSSGCIRIEKPVELAKFLLPEFTEQEIRTKMKKREEFLVNLREPVPIHIVYFTTWVNSRGTVITKKDIYKEDSKIIGSFRKNQ